MAVALLLGKPRNGKSYRALVYIIRELVNGQRPVVTNLAINFGALNAYLQRKYAAAKVNLDARLRILTAEETKRYWMYRGPDYLGKRGRVPESAVASDGLIDFGALSDGGVMYVIDEAHIHFDARKTMKASPEMAFYNSQHGKLNDDVIAITQFPKLVDCRLKDFAQTWHYFEYGLQQRILTLFRKPAMFSEKVYPGEVKGITDSAEEVHFYRLDPEVAACYDTSAGVGITGRNKPEEKRRGGLHWGFMALPVAALIALMVWLPDFITEKLVGLTNVATKTAKPVAAGSASVSPALLQPAPGAFQRPDGQVSAPYSPTPQQYTQPAVNVVKMTGYAVRAGKVNVMLSDGRTLTETDKELGLLYRNAVTVDGLKYFMASPPSGVRQAKPVAYVEGAGVESTPVRQDTEVPAVVLADAPTRSGSGARKSPVAETASSSQPETAPRNQLLGAWELGPDGVQRLRQSFTLGR